MKIISSLTLMSIVTLTLSGCGMTSSPETKELSEATKAITDLAKVAETAQKTSTNDTEAAVKTMEGFMAVGAAYEVKEFEKLESVDLPTGFPKNLVYTNGKITLSNDNGSDSGQDQDITIKTLDDVTKIRDFYKGALSANGWKIGRQQNTSGGSEYSATEGDIARVTVRIESNQYSKIAEIRVNYNKENK